MIINTTEIRRGKWNGELVWVCQYNQPDLSKKPLRNVPPTKVLVRSNDELPKGKRISYSTSHLCKLGKDDHPLKSRILSPVDNTGFRMRPGNEINAFTEYDECAKEWNRQVMGVMERIDKQYEAIDNQLRGTMGLLISVGQEESFTPEVKAIVDRFTGVETHG